MAKKDDKFHCEPLADEICPSSALRYGPEGYETKEVIPQGRIETAG